MSCIAGLRQFGTKDQGWVAHFLYSVLERKPITIYGNGFQVRDVLHVDDLVAAMQVACQAHRQTSSPIYSLGGGPSCAVSVIERLKAIHRRPASFPSCVTPKRAPATSVSLHLKYRQAEPSHRLGPTPHLARNTAIPPSILVRKS